MRDAPGASDRPVRLRSVPLWGRMVWIDEHARVWCSAHHQLHTADELAGPDSTCPEGLQRGTGDRAGLPLGEDGDERSGEFNPMTVRW